ncbi:putative MFS transporter [Thelonectria olida]|uniref:MFS transporter n=1 Tax=Thelonectria olida TaxID=1576542 RepID=A0A9P8VZU2_9HYPO|nr:putative MFS transporter [Thelonectria olida]
MSHDVTDKKASDDGENEQPKKSMFAVILVIVSILFSMFLVALDRTIISTAIPEITNEFDSLTDVGWYGSAYLLTCCALQLLFGKLYTFFPVRYVLFISVLIFEVASVICGAAPNSVGFIVGRAIAGIGAAGIFAGAMASMLHVIPLEHRPKVFGCLGGLMSIAQITGPLIGGAFTSDVTWRWCFYINLPIGGVALIAIFFLLDIPDQDTMALPLRKKVMQLDIPGTALVAPGTICLLLALQWGGQTYALQWNNGRIIALLTLAGVLLIAFGAVQVLLPATATLPAHFFKNRTVLAAFCLFVIFSCSNFIVIYFLPIWFQAITGVSAAQSGIRTIPLMASTVVGTVLGGFATSKVGYYVPFAILGTCLGSVGAGLLTTLQVDTSEAKWIGYQVLYGFGFGLIYQIPNLAIQTVLPKRDAPTGFALCLFGGLLLSTVFLSVGENVLATQLVRRLSGFQGFDASLVIGSGATSLLDALPENLREAGVVAYNQALRRVFWIGLVVTCLGVPGAASLEWKSVKNKEETDAEATRTPKGKDSGEERRKEV